MIALLLIKTRLNLNHHTGCRSMILWVVFNAAMTAVFLMVTLDFDKIRDTGLLMMMILVVVIMQSRR